MAPEKVTQCIRQEVHQTNKEYKPYEKDCPESESATIE